MARSNREKTTVELNRTTRDELWALKQGPEDSYDDVVQRLLADNQEQEEIEA